MKCDYCESELIFMDNSFALSTGMWCNPTYYCKKCDKFFDGFTAHETEMEELKFGSTHKKYLKKCFNDYYKIKDKLWVEYKNFVSSYTNGVYTIPKYKAVEFINSQFGYNYVGMQPKRFRL